MNATKQKLVVLDKKKKSVKKKQRRKSGAAKMRETADKVTGRDCKPIIEALSTNSKNGQMLSAKFLYEMARTAEESGEGNGAKKIRNVALELANAPEWKGARVERDEEDDAGRD